MSTEAEPVVGPGGPEWLRHARLQSERFWSHVRRGDGCWDWQAGTDKDGYGKFAVSLPRLNGKQQQKHVRAHRLAFVLSGGALEDSDLVLHACDRPSCCRPDHLSAGDQARNRADAAERNRTAHGERHPMRKLTEEQVVELRALSRAGWSRADLAAHFKISYPQVCSIVTGREWRRVAS